MALSNVTQSHRNNHSMAYSQIHNLLQVHIIFAEIIHEVCIGYAFGKLYLAQSRL